MKGVAHGYTDLALSLRCTIALADRLPYSNSCEDDLAASGYPHGITPYERQFIREESV